MFSKALRAFGLRIGISGSEGLGLKNWNCWGFGLKNWDMGFSARVLRIGIRGLGCRA